MNAPHKYPVLIRHNAAKPLGKVTSIRSGKGRMEVTAAIHPRHQRTVAKFAQRQYGQNKSAVYAALNQPPLWKREAERNAMLTFWGLVITLLVLIAAFCYVAGAEHTRDQLTAAMWDR